MWDVCLSRVAVTTRLTLEKDGAVVREEGVPARHFEPLVLNQGVALHRALHSVLDARELLPNHARLRGELRKVRRVPACGLLDHLVLNVHRIPRARAVRALSVRAVAPVEAGDALNAVLRRLDREDVERVALLVGCGDDELKDQDAVLVLVVLALRDDFAQLLDAVVAPHVALRAVIVLPILEHRLALGEVQITNAEVAVGQLDDDLLHRGAHHIKVEAETLPLGTGALPAAHLARNARAGTRQKLAPVVLLRQVVVPAVVHRELVDSAHEEEADVHRDVLVEVPQERCDGVRRRDEEDVAVIE